VDAYGFLFLLRPEGGLCSLGAITPPQAWHTGCAQSDPWCWKNRYAAERKGLYGALLNKNQGFLSADMAAAFYALRRWQAPREELFEAGRLSAAENLVWQAVERFAVLDTAQLHAMAKAEGISAGRCDAALKTLQEHFIVSLTGSTRRRNAKGEAYGWSIGVYEPADSWLAPLLPAVPEKDAARQQILAAVRRQNPALSAAQAGKLLHLPLCE